MKTQLTPEDYGKKLGIGAHAVRKQIRMGKLPPGVKAIAYGRFYLLELPPTAEPSTDRFA